MGRKHTEQELRKMSEAHKGDKNHMYDKHLSEECRKQLSETHMGVRNYMYGKVRINNGVINMSIPKGDPLPEGFSYGMLPRKQN